MDGNATWQNIHFSLYNEKLQGTLLAAVQGARDKARPWRLYKGQDTRLYRDKGQGTLLAAVQGQGTRGKGQGARDKGQGARDKGQGTRSWLLYRGKGLRLKGRLILDKTRSWRLYKGQGAMP